MEKGRPILEEGRKENTTYCEKDQSGRKIQCFKARRGGTSNVALRGRGKENVYPRVAKCVPFGTVFRPLRDTTLFREGCVGKKRGREFRDLKGSPYRKRRGALYSGHPRRGAPASSGERKRYLSGKSSPGVKRPEGGGRAASQCGLKRKKTIAFGGRGKETQRLNRGTKGAGI